MNEKQITKWAKGECIARDKSSNGNVVETNKDGSQWLLKRVVKAETTQAGGTVTQYQLERKIK